MKKDIYFIRHGQTGKNITHVHQHYDEPLSKTGEKQAKKLALYLKQLNIEVLITSPFLRARQTAQIISKEIGITYTIDTSVHETIRPLYLYGKKHASFQTVRFVWNLFIHRKDDKWNDDGAENMFDIRNRIHDVKDMIMETKEQTIAIVSHAVFIDMFLHLVCAQKSMSFFTFIRLIIFMKKMPNTGIVHVQYNADAPKGTCQWQFIKLINPEEFNGRT